MLVAVVIDEEDMLVTVELTPLGSIGLAEAFGVTTKVLSSSLPSAADVVEVFDNIFARR